MIIYKTVNILNGKFYVGKDSQNDQSYLGSGVILERAIKKYGRENFRKETIEICSSLDELDKKEIFWIKNLNATDRKCGYNIALGGTGGDIFNQLSDVRKKQAIKKTQSKSRVIKSTIDYKEKRSKSLKEMWSRPGYKEHMSSLMKGRKIKWKNKIKKSLKLWHSLHPITEEKRNQCVEAGKLTKGRITKPFTKQQEENIIKLYQTMGPKLIAKQINSTPYLIVSFLKRTGIYQKWQKGIGEKSKKHSSVSMKYNNRGKRISSSTFNSTITV